MVETTLIICGFYNWEFHVCQFHYQLCNPQMNPLGVYTGTEGHLRAQSSENIWVAWRAHFSRWGWTSSCFSSHNISSSTFCSVFSAMSFAFFVFLLVILLFKWPPNTTEMLSDACLMEKICISAKLLSTMNYSAINSMLMNQNIY